MRPVAGMRPLAGALALALAACTTWQPLAEGIDLARPARLPYALRATRSDGTRTTLLGPFVRGDTLRGRVARDTVSLPLGEVRLLETTRLSVARTAAVVLAVPTAFVVAHLIHCRGGRCGAQPVTP
jgi:hypothetical protein